MKQVVITDAKQSPLNPRRWLCTLECGHERWVTSKKSPKITYCLECK